MLYSCIHTATVGVKTQRAKPYTTQYTTRASIALGKIIKLAILQYLVKAPAACSCSSWSVRWVSSSVITWR